jgi:hypothetical protein
MLASMDVDSLLIMVTIIGFMLAPAALVWWEVASMHRRPRLKYRLSTLLAAVAYVAVVLSVVRWLRIEGEDVVVAAVLVAVAMAAVWLVGATIADIVHPRPVATRKDRLPLPHKMPVPPPHSTVQAPALEVSVTQPRERPKRRRRKHWWAKGIRRVNYGRYGLWKDGGPSLPT